MTLALNLWAFNTHRDCFSTHRQLGLSIPTLQGLVPRGSERTGCIPGRRKSIEGHELQRHCHWLGTCRSHRSLGTGEVLRGSHCTLVELLLGSATGCLAVCSDPEHPGGQCLHLPSLGLKCPQEPSNYLSALRCGRRRVMLAEDS